MQEAQEIVARARMWRFKPYGEVTIRMAQDANGAPVNLMQVGQGAGKGHCEAKGRAGATACRLGCLLIGRSE